MAEPAIRIVLLGKSGAGKSSLANTILGESLFRICDTADSGTSKCESATRMVNGRTITLTDNPGFFDSKKSEEELKPEIIKFTIECSPGPHAFLIVLRVETITELDTEIISKIKRYFSEKALKYSVLVFTHGNELRDRVKIEEFVRENDNLRDLLKKCGGRCHVVDNKYWNNQQDEYRNNQVQVEALLNTIDRMIQANGGGYYTNKMFQEVQRRICEEEENIRQTAGNMPEMPPEMPPESNFGWIPTTAGVLLGAAALVAAIVFGK